jgi:hypothetical protein
MTIVCMADGGASLYFSRGGGIVGAGKADTVRTAAQALLERAHLDTPSMRTPATTSTPLAGREHEKCNAAGGPFHASESESVLEAGKSIYSPLYRASQAVFRAIQRAESSGKLK